MKTIYTTLPVYDRLAKQAYQRVKYANLDMMSPIKCPQWRLPSLQWNVEADDPGEITRIKLFDKDENDKSVSNVFGRWINGAAPNEFTTFTVAGLEITSAINADVFNFAVCRTRPVEVFAGDEITITADCVKNALQVRLDIYNNYTSVDSINLATGANTINHTFVNDGTCYLYLEAVNNGAEFSLTNVTITGYNHLQSAFATTNSYIQADFTPGAAWTSAGWDTFTGIAGSTGIAQALKTTAAGEDYCQNIVVAGTVPANIAIGDIIRIVVYLTLTGDAPKIELRNTGTGAAISNTVTLADGYNVVLLTATAALATGWAITIYNSDGETTDWSAVFAAGEKTHIPHIYTVTDEYFQYNGETLNFLIPDGIYYLEIETEDGDTYYSDWFESTCIYDNLLTDPDELSESYDTFTVTGTTITSAINLAGAATAYSNLISVVKDESLRVIFFFVLNSGQLSDIRLHDLATDTSKSIAANAVIGLNDITLTATDTGDWSFRISNGAASNFSMSEIWIIREYSEKYTRINFSNTCDLGEILYSEGLEQSLWLESEVMEPTFPLEEEGAKDGYARFIRSFARQDKKWLLRTKALPVFMADVLYRMMLHDTIELIDRVGDTHTVKALEVEHEYLFDDKYYAKFDLTFDFDEAVIIGGCCNNIT